LGQKRKVEKKKNRQGKGEKRGTEFKKTGDRPGGKEEKQREKKRRNQRGGRGGFRKKNE